jgi:hypothetical protein
MRFFKIYPFRQVCCVCLLSHFFFNFHMIYIKIAHLEMAHCVIFFVALLDPDVFLTTLSSKITSISSSARGRQVSAAA